MTSRPSFTSSSDVARYLRTLTFALGGLVAVLVAVNAIGYHFGMVEAASRDIYDHQRAKTAATAPIDIAFVGDSSLGNSISAQKFGALSGLATVNLALNGSYGSGGAYNMVRKVLSGHTPRLVVVMLSIDTLRRNEAFPGFYFSAEPEQLLTTPPIRILELYFSLKTARRVLEQLWKGYTSTPTNFRNDYIAQKEPLLGATASAEVAEHPLLSGMVAQQQLGYIARIAALCNERGAMCVYAHGPIFEAYCEQATEYVATLNEGIRSAGLEVVPETPICLEEQEVGDSIDHVRSELKDTFTDRYFALLSGFLNPSKQN
jgi:hypothetical protein